ncbi:hypothetical protein BV25DRAFT_1834873 [Artomyces pyxidatus]|uniref:Uncharacterized protein n=1 Tax=Artomyces pyxidatus TaxID=48021 RepID=A0ACB8THP1_9AGAM|nr:hypothetical protein BV25DRAFT_1834873 [Artomyces pyxidatus]
MQDIPSKHSAALAIASPTSPVNFPDPQAVVREGWVLKKRRKKLQGFARRYFVLLQSGLLSYAFEPGKPFRDEIFIPRAAISTARGAKDIHIDSNNATFHMKCLNTEDFDGWMTAFRQFLAPPADGRSIGRKSSVGRAGSRNQVNKAAALVDELGSTLGELEAAIEAWHQLDAQKAVASTSKSKSEKEKHKDAKFGLFRKSHHSGHHSPPEHAVPFDEKASVASTAPSTPYERVRTAFGVLKSQQSLLSVLIPNLPLTDSLPPTVHGSPLPTTAEEQYSDRSITPTNRMAGTIGRKQRTSIAPSMSDGGSIWFDADEGFEGAQEFELDGVTPSDGPELSESRITAPQSVSSGYEEFDSSDTDEDSAMKADVAVDTKGVQHRTQLPSGPVGDEGSLFAVLRKNVGKDLASVALPVTFNEPLTLLQRLAEEVEYFNLLTEAARSEDPVQRLCYIAAFAVSGYTHTKHRSSRKGFNPMLGETFEDPRLKFISEKVSHHPVILAYHAEGDGWEMYATSSGKTKFWGKSLEIIPIGSNHVKIGEDHYEWKKPSTFMRNLMVGTKYLEHAGKMTIENLTTHMRCVVEFKENGYWTIANLVHGTVYSPSGNIEATLEGKWDEAVSRKLGDSHYHVLWKMTPFPKNALEYYGFTSWGITLNEITRDLVGRLPATDSRFRPDVRALEEGDLERAEREKERVEELQRERRRNGEDRQPRWFKQVGPEEWVYAGGYWEQRAKGWKDVEPLW